MSTSTGNIMTLFFFSVSAFGVHIISVAVSKQIEPMVPPPALPGTLGCMSL